jgi:regulator of replication initiation timing
MLSDNLLQQLKSENELLQIQLQDVNDMIKVREEELEILRETAAHAVSLQSRLDMNLDEFYQMQDHIGNQQQYAAGAAKREASLESELLQSIEMETQLYNMKDQFASTKAALADLNNEMNSLASVHKDVAVLKARITELESNLEIAALENGFLKEELDKYRREEELKKAGE